ncbi:MAG: Mov34/MPN/PAD-1 family protein [Thermincolia bacterium]
MPTVIVKIFKSALDTLLTSASTHHPNEIGGVLVGTRNFNVGVLEISIIGAVCIADYEIYRDSYLSTPGRFECLDNKVWAGLALQAVKIFGLDYIGDWHSHPGHLINFISGEDFETMLTQYVLGQFMPFLPIHVIVPMTIQDQVQNVTTAIMTDKRTVLLLKPEVI